MEAAGHIRKLERQVTYQLVRTEVPKFRMDYRCDFQYEERMVGTNQIGKYVTWRFVVEDYKGKDKRKNGTGYLTPEYKQKRRLFFEKYGIVIRET